MSAFEKWSVWVTSLLTGLTGAGYFWTKYMMEPPDAFAVANHPLQPWLLKAHILVSPLLLLAVGMILLRHVWTHFRQGVPGGRRSGLTAGLVFLPMAATGYLIQAVTHRGWLEALAIAHIAAGVLYLVGLGVHQVAIRRSGPRAERGARRARRRSRGHEGSPAPSPAAPERRVGERGTPEGRRVRERAPEPASSGATPGPGRPDRG